MDHLDHDGHVLLRSRAQVVLHVTLSLELEHHLFDGRALATDTAEFVPQTVGHALQSVLDEGFPLDQTQTFQKSPGRQENPPNTSASFMQTKGIKSDKNLMFIVNL